MDTLRCIGNERGEQFTWATELTCPACGRDAALIPLGARVDRPHRWRPWVVVVTQLALCTCCGELAATEESTRPHVTSWHPATQAA
jgi:hypothetical protein